MRAKCHNKRLISTTTLDYVKQSPRLMKEVHKILKKFYSLYGYELMKYFSQTFNLVLNRILFVSSTQDRNNVYS